MQKRPLTRRSFVAGCAAVGAAAACTGAAGTALAVGGQIGVDARPESKQVHTVCQGCSNACGYTAYVVDGKLGKAIGDAWSPQAAGTLCARGFGYTQSAFSQANVKNPMRRKPDGSFKTITWDEALSEVGTRLTDIADQSGPGAIALVYDGALPTASAYGARFMAALGSANAYVDDVTDNIVKAAAFTQVIGVDSYTADIRNADLVLLVDTSYADVATPDLAADLQAAHAAGTPIVAIDPRLGTLASFADDWVGVNPGTELALLLAVCNQLIRSNRYDAAFVAKNASGFEEWAASISGCTAEWAEGITGIPQYQIESLAARIQAAAPHVAIQYGNGSIGADAYASSGETARVVCLLNMLLGTYGAEGGALMPFDFSDAAFDAVMPPVADGEEGLDRAFPIVEFPLGRPFGASAAGLLELTKTPAVRALVLVESDVAYDYAPIKNLAEALEGLDLLVAVTQQMTQTAQLADYVLPVCPYLESASLPTFNQGMTASVSIANPVLSNPDANAWPVDQIIAGLAEACGVGDAFDFTLEEAAAAQLEAVGIALDGLQQDGTSAVGKARRVSGWPTPTGKIQCASAACEEAGLSAVPTWVPPLESSNIRAVISADMNEGQANLGSIVLEGGASEPMRVRLISGQQPVLGTHGYNVAELVDIADTYGLDGAWVNVQVAEALGIQTGDMLALSNDNASCTAKAFVTQRIVPTAVYLPSGFGHTSDKQREACGNGFNPALFSDAVVEAGYGTLCTQEACVTLEKVGE